jgi:Transglycosylase-like domain
LTRIGAHRTAALTRIAAPVKWTCVTEVTLERAFGGNATRMRKLTFVLATILTSATAPAWAAGVPSVPPQAAEDADAEPAPGPGSVERADPLQRRDAVVLGFERAQERREDAAAERRAARRAAAVPPHLQAIAQCESGGDPTAIGGGGQFRGKYQFTYATWAAVGGSGDPAQAPEAEQDRRAAMLYETSGPGQWPVCGQ